MDPRIGSLLLRGFLALCVAGLVVGVAVPLLGRRGVAPPEWVVLTSVMVFVALVIWRHIRVLSRARK